MPIRDLSNVNLPRERPGGGLDRLTSLSRAPLPGSELGDPRNAFQRGLEQYSISSDALSHGRKAITRGFLGNEEGAHRSLLEAEKLNQLASELGPRITDISDLNFDSPTFWDDLGEYLGGLAGSQLPIAVEIGGTAAAAAAATAPFGGVGALPVLGAATAGRSALSLGVNAALAPARVGLRGLGMAGRNLGRTSMLAGGAASTRLVAGETATSVGSEEEFTRGTAAKIAFTSLIGGALESFTPLRILDRMGFGKLVRREIMDEAIKRTPTKRVLEVVGTSLTEGTTEGLQELVQKLTVKWVNENREVFGPEAYNEFMNVIAAGMILVVV